MNPAHRAVELAARGSYGRLVAWLVLRCGDLPQAEDAVAEALEAALRTWPERGVPERPVAWLATTARRRLVDAGRRRETVRRATPHLKDLLAEVEEHAPPDRRLDLLFLCAHPDVPAPMRTPLVLQTVLGLNAKRIGSAFLVAPKTMGQRLVRVKHHLRATGATLDAIDELQRKTRLPAVLDTIYVAYGAGWDDADFSTTGLAREALWLARLVVHAVPNNAEALGLLALISHTEARSAARRSPTGQYVPLHEQDTTRWDPQLIQEGEKALWIASKLNDLGRYQLEAMIQSVHAYRAVSNATDWSHIHQLYELLAKHHPSIGARIAHAASFAHTGQARSGLALLDTIEARRIRRHQPYWAVHAHLCRQLGLIDAANESFARATGLSTDPAVRNWLWRQIG